MDSKKCCKHTNPKPRILLTPQQGRAWWIWSSMQYFQWWHQLLVFVFYWRIQLMSCSVFGSSCDIEIMVFSTKSSTVLALSGNKTNLHWFPSPFDFWKCCSHGIPMSYWCGGALLKLSRWWTLIFIWNESPKRRPCDSIWDFYLYVPVFSFSVFPSHHKVFICTALLCCVSCEVYGFIH